MPKLLIFTTFMESSSFDLNHQQNLTNAPNNIKKHND